MRSSDPADRSTGAYRFLWRIPFLTLLISAVAIGCSVKRTVKVEVSPKVREAKTASLEELLALLRDHAEKLTSLSSTTLKVSFTSGKIESGKLQEYRSAPGYILMKRPNLLRLNIQNPLTKTTIVELASSGDNFSVWYPRDNKYFTGQNSAKEFVVEAGQTSPVFTARPAHIYEAIIPQRISLENPRVRIAFEEDSDLTAKYYVLSLLQTSTGPRLIPTRRLWIERSALAVTKQQTFEQDGGVASIIQYSNHTLIQGLLLPLAIRIERPADGYILNLEFKSWNVNPEIPQSAFTLSPPSGAQQVVLKTKSRTESP